MLRSLYIPDYDYKTERLQFCKEITDEKFVLNEYIKTIHSFLIDICQFKNVSDLSELNSILDLIVLVTNGNLETQYGIAAQNTVLYILNNILKRQEIPFEKLKRFFLTTWENQSLESARIQDFLLLPVDTRPGLSASSLWFTMCMTSAYASSVVLSRQLRTGETSQTDLPSKKSILIRFAALFKDIGKPANRKHYIEASCKIIKQLFSEIMTQDLLNNIIDIIHKTGNQDRDKYNQALSQLLIKAEKAVSGTDCLTKIVQIIMGEEYPWAATKEFDDWDNWEKLSQSQYREISKKFEEFINSTKEKEKFIGDYIKNLAVENSQKGEDHISLIRGEARSIHEFITGNRLNEMKGGSARIAKSLLADDIDKKFTTWIVFAENHVPLENIIFAGGGNIVFVADTHRTEDLKEKIKQNFLDYVYHKTDFVIDHVSFALEDPHIGRNYTRLLSKIRHAKNDLRKQNPRNVQWGYGQTCASCLSRPAFHISPDEDPYCTACIKLFEYGNKRAFKNIYSNNKGEKLTNIPWSKKHVREDNKVTMGEVILEFIAGHSPKSLEKIYLQDQRKGLEIEIDSEREERLDIAIVSADGNNMGSFFSNIISINELAEKSAKTRIAMDRSVSKVINIITKHIEAIDLKDQKNEAMIMKLRLLLGKLLVAGDDLLFVLPAFLALPFALLLGRTFHQEMGGSITNISLAAGVLSGNPKTPIRNLYETADDIQNKSKLRSRHDKNKVFYFDYDILRGSSFGKETLAKRALLWDNFYVERPFMMVDLKDDDLIEFLRLTTNESNISSLEDFLDYTLKLYYDSFLEQKSTYFESTITTEMSTQDRLRKNIGVMQTVLNKIDFNSPSHLEEISKALTFASYKKAKERGRDTEINQNIAKKTIKIEEQLYTNAMKLLLYGLNEQQAMRLLDSYILLKQIEGGIKRR